MRTLYRYRVWHIATSQRHLACLYHEQSLRGRRMFLLFWVLHCHWYWRWFDGDVGFCWLLLIDVLLAVTNNVLVAERFAVIVAVACTVDDNVNLLTTLLFASDVYEDWRHCFCFLLLLLQEEVYHWRRRSWMCLMLLATKGKDVDDVFLLLLLLLILMILYWWSCFWAHKKMMIGNDALVCYYNCRKESVM